MEKPKSIVLIGDKGCGKSSFVEMAALRNFTTRHIETDFQDYHFVFEGQNGPQQLCIYDTSGSEMDFQLRSLCYPECDAVLVCFDLTDPYSFKNVENVWIPELKLRCPKKPFFLVGCKKDLLRVLRKLSVDFTTDLTLSMDDPKIEEGDYNIKLSRKANSPRVNVADILSLQLSSGAKGYFECSARVSENVSEILNVVVNYLNSASTLKKHFWSKEKLVKRTILKLSTRKIKQLRNEGPSPSGVSLSLRKVVKKIKTAVMSSSKLS